MESFVLQRNQLHFGFLFAFNVPNVPTIKVYGERSKHHAWFISEIQIITYWAEMKLQDTKHP